jgi:MFS family permease
MPLPAPLLTAPVPPLPPSAAPARLFSRDFVVLCVSSFLFSLSMFLLFAVLPLFVVQALHGANSQVGLIMGAFAVSAVLARPSSGRIVDLWSRKAGLSLGAGIFALAPALYTQAHAVALMVGLRLFHGIGVALYTTAGSVLAADLCPPARRAEGMGYYGMSMNLAMAFGPALGAALLPRIGFTGLFALCALLGLLSLLFVQAIRERPQERAHNYVRPPLFSTAALLPGFVAMCMTMTFGAVISFLPLLVQAHNLGNPGLYFTLYALIVVATRPLAGRVADCVGRGRVIVPGMACLVVAMTLLAYTTTWWGLLWAAVLQGLGFGSVHPAVMALVVDRSSQHDRGPALATLMGAFDIGVGLSAIGLGLVLEHSNFTVTYLCAAGIALIGGSVFALVSLHQSNRQPAQG